MSSFEIISDYSKANLREIPENILEMTNLKMLFLERNLLVKLPVNFFNRLPNLMWLDLRNNQLEELPISIAHHEHLEHLLLTNNNITKLPNELGLVMTLKALQVADNPLVYPTKKIIQEGTKAIKRYLKEQYEIECAKNAEKHKQAIEAQEEFKRQLQERERAMEMQEERLIKVHEKASDIESINRSNKTSKDTFYSGKIALRRAVGWVGCNHIGGQARKIMINLHTGKIALRRAVGWVGCNHIGGQARKIMINLHTAYTFNTIRSRESAVSKQNSKTIEHIQNKLSDPNGLNPTLRVKKIEHPNMKPEEPLKIIHTVSKSESKISLKSYFQKTGNQSNLDQIPENILKEGWLNKLRILLNDQERILQQERNLKALSAWRQKIPSTPKIFCDSDGSCYTRKSEPPYATYPEYSRIPSRGELASQLQAFLKEPDVNTRSAQTSQLNLDKVINDLMQQLKDMENNPSGVRSPRSEIEHTGIQIQKIVDIHKKLLQLKSTNDYF